MKKNTGAALLRTALLGCLAIASSALSAASSPASGQHGATAMGAQQQRLDQLVTSAAGAPPGVDPVAWSKIYLPPGNEPTADRIALGRKLYFDTRLSKDGTVACATCHDVSRGFADHRNVSEGIGERLGRRSAPTTMNAALFQSMF
jgi:cytochrome c peroxidase